MKKAKNKEITKLFKDIKIIIDDNFPGPACIVGDKLIRKNEIRPITKRELKWMMPGKNFDNQHFWKSVHETFGTLAVTNSKDLSIEKANEITLQLSKDFKLLEQLKVEKNGMKILEIGSGYGNFYNWLEGEGFNMSDYYSIDVYPYFSHENLHITDGNTFPKDLPKFDIVYCCNVLQHLTQHQRNMYYKNIANHLTFGGVFYGSNTFKHPSNKDMEIDVEGRKVKLWGIKGEDGNDYLTFFGQYTEVEDSIEWSKRMEKLNLMPKLISGAQNFFTFQAIKKWTIN